MTWLADFDEDEEGWYDEADNLHLTFIDYLCAWLPLIWVRLTELFIADCWPSPASAVQIPSLSFLFTGNYFALCLLLYNFNRFDCLDRLIQRNDQRNIFYFRLSYKTINAKKILIIF
jgi:hypothetical protein